MRNKRPSTTATFGHTFSNHPLLRIAVHPTPPRKSNAQSPTMTPDTFQSLVFDKEALVLPDDARTLCAVLVLPHIYYYFLWTNPKAWLARCKKHKWGDACHAMANGAHVFKAAQFYALYRWYTTAGAGAWANDWAGVAQWQWLVAVACAGAGQFLNYSIYKAIGEDGVYYGTKFGKHIPWCYDFPFDRPWLRHPQYLGVVLTLVGACTLLATRAHVEAGLVGVFVFWVACYAFTAYQEDHPEWSEKAKAKGTKGK